MHHGWMDGIRSDSGFRQHHCDVHEVMKSIFIFYLTVLKLLEGEDRLVSVVEGYYRQQSQGKSVKTTTKVLGFFKYDEFSESTVGHREYYCIFWVEKICTKGEYTFSCDVCVCVVKVSLIVPIQTSRVLVYTRLWTWTSVLILVQNEY